MCKKVREKVRFLGGIQWEPSRFGECTSQGSQVGGVPEHPRSQVQVVAGLGSAINRAWSHL